MGPKLTQVSQLKMPKVQNSKTPIPQRVILPNLFHQQLNLPEQNTNHSNKDITWSTPGHDWQNGWKTIYVVSTCRTDDSTKAAHFWFDDWFVFFHVILFCQCELVNELNSQLMGIRPIYMSTNANVRQKKLSTNCHSTSDGRIDWLPFWVWVGIISFWHFEPLVFCFCRIFNVWQTGLGKTDRNRPKQPKFSVKQALFIFRTNGRTPSGWEPKYLGNKLAGNITYYNQNS